ncbi:MAG TPA: hypothetical protein VJ933_01530 [Phaeodactylibacter sp.]|nr:hypothetical protein [Phaeodactylibacter sp.]
MRFMIFLLAGWLMFLWSGCNKEAVGAKNDRAYYAKGVGLIQYTQYYPAQQLELGMRLIDATLN